MSLGTIGGGRGSSGLLASWMPSLREICTERLCMIMSRMHTFFQQVATGRLRSPGSAGLCNCQLLLL